MHFTKLITIALIGISNHGTNVSGESPEEPTRFLRGINDCSLLICFGGNSNCCPGWGCPSGAFRCVRNSITENDAKEAPVEKDFFEEVIVEEPKSGMEDINKISKKVIVTEESGSEEAFCARQICHGFNAEGCCAGYHCPRFNRACQLRESDTEEGTDNNSSVA